VLARRLFCSGHGSVAGTAGRERAQVSPSADSGPAFSIACLSPQPWEIDLPTNRQQIMARAARRGHPVLFVDCGTFVGRHLRALLRGPRRRSTARRLVSSQEVAPGIRTTIAPNVLPWGHTYALAARVNARLTARAIRRRLRRLPAPAVLWLYDPCFADAIGRSGERFAVYDCVDDYPEQTGGHPRKHALVTACDRAAAERSRVVFATAVPLVEWHRGSNPRTHLVRNVGDFQHFVPAADRAYAPEALATLERPVVGFAGNFLGEKVDFELLERIARSRPEWTLLLVGPERADTAERLRELAGLPNVVWTGPVPYAEVPRAIAAFDVGLIPYVSNAYTRSCFPLKLYEYLAAGKPVVATGLPELAGLEPHAVLAPDADAAVRAVEWALGALGNDDREARQGVAAQNTWDTRTARLLDLVAAEL
jgi:glycosyltransferase involved in cell wall biosynthesis